MVSSFVTTRSARHGSARAHRVPLGGACPFAAVLLFASSLHAQSTDSLRAQADSARHIERVLVTAIRASDAAPIAQKTIDRATITQRQFGQDVPLLLQGLSPSLTAHTETGTPWGYSYLRLRDVDACLIHTTQTQVAVAPRCAGFRVGRKRWRQALQQERHILSELPLGDGGAIDRFLRDWRGIRRTNGGH